MTINETALATFDPDKFTKPVKSFAAFRKIVARLYRETFGRAKRGSERSQRMAVLQCSDYEGPAVQRVFDYWTGWEDELECPADDLPDEWRYYGIGTCARDAVIEHFDLSGSEVSLLDRCITLIQTAKRQGNLKR